MKNLIERITSSRQYLHSTTLYGVANIYWPRQQTSNGVHLIKIFKLNLTSRLINKNVDEIHYQDIQQGTKIQFFRLY